MLVERVEPASATALAGLRAGDLLLEVRDRATPDTAAVEAEVRAIEAEQPRFVIFFVRRGIQTLYIEVEPDWADGEDRGPDVADWDDA